MKLWVDDERSAPDASWYDAADSSHAIRLLDIWSRFQEEIYPRTELEEVSLDHDLGGDDTGFKVLDWMIEHGVWPKVLTIHTSNPPARKRMPAAANAEGPADMEIYVITDHTR